MSFTKEQVVKIAKLAHIRLEGDDAAHYAKELSGIFNWIEQLQAVNTDGVPAMTSVAAMTLPMREDAITDGNVREKVLHNAPAQEYDCFAVPKVIE